MKKRLRKKLGRGEFWTYAVMFGKTTVYPDNGEPYTYTRWSERQAPDGRWVVVPNVGLFSSVEHPR